jgi:hypothetical protein
MRRFLTSLALMTATFTGSAALAETHPVVIELYTSQGCSSCPPADEMLAELSQRDDVIALALHVDYWDYIGWADDFANPAYTQRQHDYASAAGSATVYTPQMVIGGVDHVIGSRPMEVTDLLRRHWAKESDVSLNITRDAETLQVTASYANAATPMIVQLVRFSPYETRQITRGENAGREITYTNIVRSIETLTAWDGGAELALDTPLEGDDPVAVLIQQGTNGPILAAAQLR